MIRYRPRRANKQTDEMGKSVGGKKQQQAGHALVQKVVRRSEVGVERHLR